MRTGFVIALCLLIIVLTGGILLADAADETAGQCFAAAGEISALVQMGDWRRARGAQEAYALEWEKSRDLFILLMPEKLLDSISEAYERLGTAIAYRDEQTCVDLCKELARSAEDMRANEELTVSSLL